MSDICEHNEPVPVEPTALAVPPRANALGRAIGGIVQYTAGVVISMPKLEEPKYDEEYLPENANILKSVAYTWLYNWKKFEYSVDPLRRGFHAWIRLALSIAFFIALPVAVVVGIAYGLILCIVKFCGVFDATFQLIKSVLWVMLGVIGVILLGYLIYLVIAAICGWPVKLPSLNVIGSKKGD